MMNIGVVCEGPTDFFAIRNFFGSALLDAGVNSKIDALQPDMDNTNPRGGWVNVITWLTRNPPEARNINVFGGGLFSIASVSYDALIVQMDTDILDDPLFSNYILKNFNYRVRSINNAIQRADEIRAVLRLAGRFDEMTLRDVQRHVLSPAVESTENWCVAAFTTPTVDFEALSGQRLADAFMSALQRFEGRNPIPPYGDIDKSMARRDRFCQAHAPYHVRVADGCEQFRIAKEELVALSR